MFGRNSAAKKHPEPTKEQVEEERRFAEKNAGRPRTVTSETTQLVRLTNAVVDRAIDEMRKERESVKSLRQYVSSQSGITDPHTT